MRKVLKWIVIIVGSLLLILIIAIVILGFIGRAQVNKTYAYDVQPLTLPTDQASLDRGQHLVQAVSICTSCHKDNLSGDDLGSFGPVGSFVAPNLTSGAGGIGEEYAVEDWVRALRHGVDPEGKPFIFMPSHIFAHYSDSDLADIIAYIQSVPPVDHKLDETKLTFLGDAVIATGLLGKLPVKRIDHDAQPTAPAEGVTPEYGSYLVSVAMCKECHGSDLNGGPKMGPPPGPDLTRSSDLSGWTETDFINTIRNGITPDGDKLDKDEMPWDYFTLMTDDELKAIWSYLQTLD